MHGLRHRIGTGIAAVTATWSTGDWRGLAFSFSSLVGRDPSGPGGDEGSFRHPFRGDLNRR